MTKFKYGDRVRCVKDDTNDRVVGKVGTVIDFHSKEVVGVTFDEDVNGHSMSGRTYIGHGWYLKESGLELVDASDTKVIITIKDKTTTAKMMVGKHCVVKAVAKCSPNDTFDPLVGAQIALQRLVEQRGSKFVVNSKMFNDVEVI